MSNKSVNLWLILILVLIATSSSKILDGIRLNRAYLSMDLIWLNLRHTSSKSDQMQDGIPDGWIASNWGQARGTFDLDSDIFRNGQRSARIVKNSSKDASVYQQQITLPVGGSYLCKVYHRGDKAFIRIDGKKIAGETYKELISSDRWTFTAINFTSSLDVTEAVLSIGIREGGSIVWLDDAICQSENHSNVNLLINARFESDGDEQNPLTWWLELVSANRIIGNGFDDQNLFTLKDYLENKSNSPSIQNRINAIYLLNGNFAKITERMNKNSVGCLYSEYGSPEFLLDFGRKFESEGGMAGHEKVLKLAINLMPMCPQPYAQLAKLYSVSNSNLNATDLYRKASDLASPGRQKGAYLFDEGRLHIISTGNLDRAIDVLIEAKNNRGWESTSWHYGIADLYLGQAYRLSGKCTEARLAYESILDCKLCTLHYAQAQHELSQLEDCSP